MAEGYQSYQSGIETEIMDEEVYSFMNYQSYQSGIETPKWKPFILGLLTTNRTNLELKRISKSYLYKLSCSYQSYQSGIETIDCQILFFYRFFYQSYQSGIETIKTSRLN